MSTGSLARKMSSESPVLNWEGILRSKDRKTYIYFPFEVDRDVYYLKVRLSFYQTPGNMLFLYCFDPGGFRGRGKEGIEGPGGKNRGFSAFHKILLVQGGNSWYAAFSL